MENKKNQKKHLILYFSYILFFITGVFYLYRYTNYIFFYQEKSSLFQTTMSFFLEKINQPGGFLQYLGGLQTALYYYPFIGAILVTLEIVAVMGLISAIGNLVSGKRAFLWPFLLGGTLFYLQTHYQYWSFNTIGILIQIFFFYVSIRYTKRKTEWIPVFLFPLNYFLFGSFSALFLVMFLIWLVQNRQKGWPLKMAGLFVWGVAFFVVSEEFLFFQTIKSLLIFPYSSAKIGEQIRLFLAVLFLFGILPLLYRISPGIVGKLRNKNFPVLEFIPVALIVVFALLSIGRIDQKNTHYFYVEKLFYQQEYETIIAFNTKNPSNNILTNYLNNIALAETGQLGDRFFSFPQSTDGGTLFLKWDLVTEVLKRGGYFYYTIGMVNEAQRWAYEFMVMRGLTPEGLKMLIKSELINENYKVAQKYIDILRHTLFYKKEAKVYEKLLFDDAAVNSHPELGQKKELKTKQDFFVLSEEPAANLDFIIEVDSSNYAAIEYKMAWLMLQKDMQKIVAQLPVLEKCGFQKIPKNVEEATVAYQQLNIGELPDLDTLKVSREAVQRFRQYYQIFQQNSSNREQAQRALAGNFSNTFWYYVFFS